MTIYYIEKKIDGTTSLFSGKMEDRAAFWIKHPNAKEISKKEYQEWVAYLKKHQELITPFNYNKNDHKGN